MERDGVKQSFWEEEITLPETGQASGHDFDIIIVGAGITGLTLAYELQKRGKNCLLLEKAGIGFGTTGGTTAHINNFFDTSYHEVISDFSEESATVLAEAAKKTVSYIKKNVERLEIDCDFAECNFYLFSAEESQNKMLDDIFKAHQQVGIETSQVFEIPFTLDFEKAIEIKGQAQLHPLKYINALAEAFQNIGGILLTGRQVKDYTNKNGSVTLSTEQGERFSAQQLIWATHIPPGNNRYNLLVAPYRSYAMTVEIAEAPPKMAQTADLYDPYHYVRYHQSQGKNYLIIGGFDHKTGHEEDTSKSFEELEKYAKDNFTFERIVAKWSSQYYIPADGLPFIGKMPGEENVYISTGYNGNGMTFGTMASLIIPDLIEGKETELSKLLSPSRINVQASAKTVVQENADAVFNMVKDKFSAEKIEGLKEIQLGEGKLVKYEGKTIAAYRESHEKFHLLNPTCPHMGCNVLWNTAEKSWDCPCHGSRFDVTGNLLNGPATSDLGTIQ